MKYITSALVVLALLGQPSNAIRINSKVGFTDDLVKSLAEEMSHDAEQPAAEEEAKPAPKQMAEVKKSPAKAKVADKAKSGNATANSAGNATKKAAPVSKAKAKKAVKEEEDIPMDSAAIKAYSSVIADAAEDSEPTTPVTYSAVIQEEEPQQKHEVLGLDPMGSMI